MLIDTHGPEGNAFSIMGLVRLILEQTGRLDEWPAIRHEMKAGDYRHLCEVATKATYGTLEFIFPDDDEEEESC
jgi:hypothetical protein